MTEAQGPLTTKTGKVLTDSDIQALADEAEKGYDVSHLLGVVEPEEQLAMEGMPTSPPSDRDPRPYEEARDRLAQAQAITQERLRDLRKQREEINAEVKLLVAEDELLARMLRIARADRRATAD